MRFLIPVIVDLPDDQLAEWAAVTDVAQTHGQVRAKDAVDAMRAQVPGAIQLYFEGLGVRADVSVKR